MKKELLNAFGKKVRNLRLQNEWSQEKLAEETDFHRTYIGMIERGERNPSLSNVAKFAKAFNISISQLFDAI